MDNLTYAYRCNPGTVLSSTDLASLGRTLITEGYDVRRISEQITSDDVLLDGDYTDCVVIFRYTKTTGSSTPGEHALPTNDQLQKILPNDLPSIEAECNDLLMLYGSKLLEAVKTTGLQLELDQQGCLKLHGYLFQLTWLNKILADCVKDEKRDVDEGNSVSLGFEKINLVSEKSVIITDEENRKNIEDQDNMATSIETSYLPGESFCKESMPDYVKVDHPISHMDISSENNGILKNSTERIGVERSSNQECSTYSFMQESNATERSVEQIIKSSMQANLEQISGKASVQKPASVEMSSKRDSMDNESSREAGNAVIISSGGSARDLHTDKQSSEALGQNTLWMPQLSTSTKPTYQSSLQSDAGNNCLKNADGNATTIKSDVSHSLKHVHHGSLNNTSCAIDKSNRKIEISIPSPEQNILGYKTNQDTFELRSPIGSPPLSKGSSMTESFDMASVPSSGHQNTYNVPNQESTYGKTSSNNSQPLASHQSTNTTGEEGGNSLVILPLETSADSGTFSKDCLAQQRDGISGKLSPSQSPSTSITEPTNSCNTTETPNTTTSLPSPYSDHFTKDSIPPGSFSDDISIEFISDMGPLSVTEDAQRKPILKSFGFLPNTKGDEQIVPGVKESRMSTADSENASFLVLSLDENQEQS